MILAAFFGDTGVPVIWRTKLAPRWGSEPAAGPACSVDLGANEADAPWSMAYDLGYNMSSCKRPGKAS